MEKRIRYSTEYSDQLARLLEDHKVPYTRSDEELRRNGFDDLVYTISERHPQFELLSKRLISFPQTSVLETVHYSEQERLNAEWLTIRAFSTKVVLCREEETFVCSGYYKDGAMAHHRGLTGAPFYVAGPLRHSRHQNFFCSHEASDYHIFCTGRSKQTLESADAEICFAKVLRASTGEPIDDLYYMDFQNPLPVEAVFPDNCPEQYICPCCGRITYFPPMYPLKIRRGDFAGCRTACKTAEMFSFGGNITFSLPMISQALYRVLKENALLRGLDISPVEIVE